MINKKSIEQLVACLAITNRFADIDSLFTNKLNGYKDLPSIRYYRALAFARQGKTEEAICDLKHILNADKSQEESRILLFELCINKALEMHCKKENDRISEIVSDIVNYAPNTAEAKERLSAFSNAIPINHIRNGKRKDAICYWEKEMENGSFDISIIHSLAITYYWWILSLQDDSENNLSPEQIDLLWFNTLSYWTILLNSDDFWMKWRKEKQDNWGTSITDEELYSFKKSIKNEMLINRLHSLVDKEKQNTNQQNVWQFQKYLAALSLEQITSKLWQHARKQLENKINKELSKSTKRFEIIRDLQGKMDKTQCYGTKKDCKEASCPWTPDCYSARNGTLPVNLPAGLLYFKNRNLDKDILKLVEFIHSSNQKDADLAQLRVYFSSLELGLHLELSHEADSPFKAMESFEKLSKEIQERIEGKYVCSRLHMAIAEYFLRNTNIEEALSSWKKALAIVNNEKDRSSATACGLDILFLSIDHEIKERIEKACEEQCRNMHEAEAIAVLESAISIIEKDSLKKILAVHYVNKGRKENAEKRFDNAREWLDKALALIPGLESAKLEKALSYNNQATNTKDVERQLDLYEKALELAPDDAVYIKNYAAICNAKAVGILNSMNQYNVRNDVRKAIPLLERALRMINPVCSPNLKNPYEFMGMLKFMQESQLNSFLTQLTDEQLKLIIKNLNYAYSVQNKINGIGSFI